MRLRTLSFQSAPDLEIVCLIPLARLAKHLLHILAHLFGQELIVPKARVLEDTPRIIQGANKLIHPARQLSILHHEHTHDRSNHGNDERRPQPPPSPRNHAGQWWWRAAIE